MSADAAQVLEDLVELLKSEPVAFRGAELEKREMLIAKAERVLAVRRRGAFTQLLTQAKEMGVHTASFEAALHEKEPTRVWSALLEDDRGIVLASATAQTGEGALGAAVAELFASRAAQR